MLPKLKFYYKNYKGKFGYRTVQDPSIYFGSTNHHKEEQWLLRAFDIDKQDIRIYAVKDIIEFVSIN